VKQQNKNRKMKKWRKKTTTDASQTADKQTADKPSAENISTNFAVLSDAGDIKQETNKDADDTTKQGTNKDAAPKSAPEEIFRLPTAYQENEYYCLSNDINDDDSGYWGDRTVIPDKVVEQRNPMQIISSVPTEVSELGAVPEESSVRDFSAKQENDSTKNYRSTADTSSVSTGMSGVAAVLISIQDLIKLRRYAEVGPILLGGLCFVGGIATVLSIALDLLDKVRNEEDWPTLSYIIFSIYTWIFGVFVIILEGRPFQITVSSVHLWISDYLKILRFLYGRGLLYLFVGSIQYLVLSSPYSAIAGGLMIILGIICYLVGLAAKVSWDNARALNPSDHTKLKLKFELYDIDNDGYLNIEGFQDFVVSLGLNELENINFDTAFHAIDRNKDAKISFDELEMWWSLVDYRNQTNILDNRIGSNYNIA